MTGAIIGDPAYCAQTEVTLKAKEKLLSLSGDGFTIKGADDQVWFKVDNKLFSMREKRVMEDAYGRPACGLHKKMISLKPTWVITRGGDFEQPIATIKQKLLTLKPQVNVFLAGNDKDPDFKCKGNFLGKKFEVLDVRGGQETVIARIHKESRFSSAGAFFKAALTEADTYFITGSPGVDMAFVTALCLAVDELFKDEK